jgi:hypothetical protein
MSGAQRGLNFSKDGGKAPLTGRWVVDDEHDGVDELSDEASSDADGRGNDQRG